MYPDTAYPRDWNMVIDRIDFIHQVGTIEHESKEVEDLRFESWRFYKQTESTTQEQVPRELCCYYCGARGTLVHVPDSCYLKRAKTKPLDSSNASSSVFHETGSTLSRQSKDLLDHELDTFFDSIDTS